MSTSVAQPLSSMARVAIRSLRPISGRRNATANATTRSIPVSSGEDFLYGTRPSKSNWSTIDTQLLSRESLHDLLQNKVPDVRVPSFLSGDECQSLVKIIKTHQIGSYNENVYPPIGSVGITQFDHAKDKTGYFSKVNNAKALQDRFRKEANIDVVDRVRNLLQQKTGLPVRIAQDNDREYFAGLIRLINKSALLHADYGRYDGPQWEIGRITAQITWNILLKQVDGGESVVYDRFWQGASDDTEFKNAPPSYGYSHRAVEGRALKKMSYEEGDLHFFNSRNFHEVKALLNNAEESRYTMTSFVGLLPDSSPSGPGLIMWS
jgi:hypothetical protein